MFISDFTEITKSEKNSNILEILLITLWVHKIEDFEF